MTGSNVLGEPLEPCSFAPLTGFWRDGHCRTGAEDIGVHGVWVNGARIFDGKDYVAPPAAPGEVLTQFG